MKILDAAQIRNWDQYSISHEPISSIDLMERAASGCVDWIETAFATRLPDSQFQIYCGKGNNGGDGLAMARLLSGRGYTVNVHILEFGHKGTDDFQVNLARLHQHPSIPIRFIQSREQFHELQPTDLVIDALYGTGLNRPLEGVSAELVHHINDAGVTIISIDIPSGLLADESSKGLPAIHATHTLSFQCYKMAFLVAENADFIGTVHLIDIALHPAYYDSLSSDRQLVDPTIIRNIYRPRNAFSHKGSFGHALIVAGSYGKMGAAVLAARSCLRSGAGLLTCHIPSCGYAILQTALPEAMVMTDFNSSFVTRIEADLEKFDAIGIGPGIGTATETRALLHDTLNTYRQPLVLDADALNILASKKEWLTILPPGSILTPHPKEFERMFGESRNEFERISLAIQKATELNCVIVLKGHHTLTATPDGRLFFNGTGNAGMATGGSGDTLTGILTSLLAQGYPPADAAVFGVYLHGLAGDYAAAAGSMESLIAGDITDNLAHAFAIIKDY